MKRYLRVWLVLFGLIFFLGWSIAPPSTGEEKSSAPAAQKETPGRDARFPLRVLHGGEVEEMNMADYLAGVLRAEMPASFEPEALKAQAIAARTYTIYRMERGPIAAHPEADACDSINCCKAYRTAEAAAAAWGEKAEEYEAKIRRAVEQTDGEVILYDDAPVLAVFFSSAPGRTQSAGKVWCEDLPYLQSVSSPETQERVPEFYSTVRLTREEFCARVRALYPDAEFSGGPLLSELHRGGSGYVESVRTGGLKLRGDDLRAALSLRSPCFTAQEDGDGIVFHVTGYGHGVGMSQYGANIFAAEGRSCEEILEHYYSGAEVGVWKEESIAMT